MIDITAELKRATLKRWLTPAVRTQIDARRAEIIATGLDVGEDDHRRMMLCALECSLTALYRKIRLLDHNRWCPSA